MADEQRLPGLDIVRALAITLVVVAHGALLAAPAISFSLRSQLLYLGGYTGVELFFALSGFLIVGGLLRQLDTRPVLDGRAVITFWQRRWWRTLPNYAVFLSLNATLFAAWFQTPTPGAHYSAAVNTISGATSTSIACTWVILRILASALASRISRRLGSSRSSASSRR
jgi:peptidoglycan/LPS O-acetylase OafA/YrhL|tara:strand:- start:1000 stop:1506 length:507 start_codon:yes stop_codon:yes gene_type:complete